MGYIKKITHKSVDKRLPSEPFAAIHYDGSYPSASEALCLVGLDNLNLSKFPNLNSDELIDNLMDDTSNLKFPEIYQNDNIGLIYHRPVTLHVDSWLVLEVTEDGLHTEVVIYPDGEFKAKYIIAK